MDQYHYVQFIWKALLESNEDNFWMILDLYNQYFDRDQFLQLFFQLSLSFDLSIRLDEFFDIQLMISNHPKNVSNLVFERLMPSSHYYCLTTTLKTFWISSDFHQ